MFDPKHPEAEDSFKFDYTDELAAGETISTAEIEVTVINGTDANPSAMLGGSPTVASPFVYVKLIGGVDGVIYCVKCVATTSTGLKKTLEGDLKVDASC